MHNQMMGSTGMDHETPQLDQDNTYGGHDHWVDLNAYAHWATMTDHGHHFGGYMAAAPPPMSTGLPSESMSRMPPPPPRPPPAPAAPPGSAMAQPPVTHAQLPMLMVPAHATWPSMLTNAHGYGLHSAPPLAMAPAASAPPLKTARLPSLQTTSQPRKTLTDDDRRRMCEYAESHPQAKQTDIGSIFGVERSTVSKVLRNKEKYLYPEDRSHSSIKRTKSRISGADMEKALANFVRNAQKSGATVTTDELQEKARLFSATMTGTSAENFLKGNNSVWLDKFMHKNGLGGAAGMLLRRASSDAHVVPDTMGSSPSLPSSSQPSSAISPSSPAVQPSPSSVSAGRSDEDKGVLLNSAFGDHASSSLSVGLGMSPSSGPFAFSPNPDISGFHGGDKDNNKTNSSNNRQARLPGTTSHGVGLNFQRPRSQTFPTLDLEHVNVPHASTAGEPDARGTSPLTPKYHHVASSLSSTAPSSALGSPENDLSAAPFGLTQTLASPPHSSHQQQQQQPTLRRSTSTSSLGATAAAAATGSLPVSPSHEDACRAADTLLCFIQSAGGFVNQNEYMAVVRLTEKLRIHQTQMAQAAAAAGSGGMGCCLSQIPEGDSEMTNAPPVAVKVEPMGS